MDTTKKWFHYLHTTRNLSTAVISEAKLKVTNNRLEIPIFDRDGNRTFSKFRKEPWDESDGPKYTYEYGSHIALYGIHCKSQHERLFTSEGELDQMALRTVGYDAYTSTGGAMSWQKNWKLKRIPTVLYDNDEAGIGGAIRTILMLGRATYSWIPPMYGKDISDVLASHGKEFCQKLLEDPSRQIEIDITDLTTKASIMRKRKEFQAIARNMENSVGQKFMVGLSKKMVELEKSYSPQKLKVKNMPLDTSSKDRAKSYPIQNLIRVGTVGDSRNKAKCPFHKSGQEKTPSLHVYSNNTAYCHGCGKYCDSIDIYMHQHNLSGTDGFKQAIDELSKKT